MGSKKVREMVQEKKNYSGSQNSISPTDFSEILRKFFAEVKTEKGQALTPSALTGIRATIHRDLTCAPLSLNINILQDSEFIYLPTKCLKRRPSYFRRKQCETKTQIIYSVRRYAEIESILHGRAEHGRRLEKCGEVS